MEKSRCGGRILVDALLAQGCDRIFCVPGESYLPVLDALVDAPSIDLVVARQEGGASFMACADGTLTGRPGICFATRGPGATNATIGVHVARQDSIPLILFVGDVARGDRDREAFQEIDFPAMFAPLAKWAARIDDAARIPEYVARAYRTAMSGRPGPVVLALPEDMLSDHAKPADRPWVDWTAQPTDAATVDAVVARIAAARAPIAIVGGAGWASRASHAFTAFAESAGMPVATPFRRQDAVPNLSPVYAGNLGYGPNPALVARLKASDLILAVGARLGEATTDGYRLIEPDHPAQTLIHVHPDPDELGRVFRTDLAVCADVAHFSEAMAAAASRFTRRDDGAAAHAEWLAWSTAQSDGTALDLGRCVAAMQAVLPDDTIICNGAGNYSGWWHRYWRYAGPVCQIAPTAGAMGYGVPAAVATALRHPDRRVVALAGDGCFQMNGQELATAAAHGCRLLVIVVDNGSYGTIRMHQERRYPGRVSGTDIANPDFAALARAYGGWGVAVANYAEFGTALDEALAQPGIALLHLRSDIERITPALTIKDLHGPR